MQTYKYRIVTDAYCGFEVQVRCWWWPFWRQARFTNTHTSLERAEQWIAEGCPRRRSKYGRVVKVLP